MADGQRHQNPPQWAVLGLLQVLEESFSVRRQRAILGAEEFSLGELIGAEGEQVTFVGDDRRTQQRGRRLVAQALDVESAAAGEVKHPLPQLRRARSGVRAPNVDITLLGRGEQRPALRTVGRHDELALGAVTQVNDRAEHLGDHITGLADHHRVADQHTLAFDLGGVVQCRHAHRGSGDAHRSHERERGDASGAADVDLDIDQRGLGLFRRVLVRHRPPGRPRGRAQAPLLGEVVDLDHHAIDLVLDLMAALAPELDALFHRGQSRHPGRMTRDRQPPSLHCQIRVVQRGRGEAPGVLGIAQSVADHPKWAPCGDGRVLLSQRPGGAIAGISERRLAVLDQAGIEGREIGEHEEDLATDLQHCWDREFLCPG